MKLTSLSKVKFLFLLESEMPSEDLPSPLFAAPTK